MMLPETEREAIASQIAEIGAAGHRVLECRFAIARAGRTEHATYYFWHRDVPVAKADLRRVSNYHPLLALGDAALEACPRTAVEAEERRREVDGLPLPRS